MPSHMSSEPAFEVADHYEAQKRDWRIQRIGWGVLAVTLLIGVLGGLGPGLLGKVSERDKSGLLLEYDRFVRYEAPNSVQIELPPSDSGEQEFLLDASWVHRVHLETVQPEPLRVRSESEGVRFAIGVPRGGAPTRVTLHYEPDSPGVLSGGIALSTGARLAISQFVYP